MSAFFLSQILAGIAFALGLASFQFKPRRAVLMCLSAATAFNASHFFLLGRSGPAILILLTGVRYLTALFTLNRKCMYFFLLASLGAFLITFKSPLSFLALFATLVGTYGSFQPADRIIRISFMMGNAAWLIHNILAVTPVAAVMEASFLTSNVLGYWRFYHARQEPV